MLFRKFVCSNVLKYKEVGGLGSSGSTYRVNNSLTSRIKNNNNSNYNKRMTLVLCQTKAYSRRPKTSNTYISFALRARINICSQTYLEFQIFLRSCNLNPVYLQGQVYYVVFVVVTVEFVHFSFVVIYLLVLLLVAAILR